MTVDAYAVQHAGGPHPDKSVDIHLCGLFLVLERGFKPVTVPPMMQRIVSTIDVWPHFAPPREDSRAVPVAAHRGLDPGHVGKSSELVLPAAYTMPALSTAMQNDGAAA